ncbi:thiamine biosynthesis protein ThiF [Isoptericola sp. b490]|uniref:thiamine biosynthesis protein ThiF n=1 Tax=Actinotalea lenta TaxID=3064654 RepID=UPI00271365B8|nr:thiamine biosynthesis protein ThiF [Isoptericola sp. b490]MDO8122682.1 thiamine biosynthesis protein ThiF [Isoptericola sp. b490]
MQLRTLPVVRRDTTTVQVGTDPRWAVALGDLSPPAAGVLAALPPGAPERTMRTALQAAGVDAEEADAILDHLARGHLMVRTPAAVPPAEQADLRAWSLLSADGDVAPLLAARAAARVRIWGLDRVGTAVAQTLALAGVGRLELDDPTPVLPADVGFGGLTDRDLGEPRELAVARAVRAARPRAQTLAAVGRSPDLVVLVDRAVADPVRHTPLRDAGVPHLSVLVREASVLVGPLVVPGSTACLTCAELHRADADPAWPLVAAQLVAARASASLVAESTLAVAAGALATVQVLAHLDGRPCATHDAALELSLPLTVPRAQHWLPHPECGCGSQVR